MVGVPEGSQAETGRHVVQEEFLPSVGVRLDVSGKCL